MRNVYVLWYYSENNNPSDSDIKDWTDSIK